ncbi:MULTISPECIES: AraC family transcriptional regulator [unclassified Undibacterium]|uniref:AraC family transcriptional regulator n=1 Tax=unclassified Undibacterium TaxID=2630295 RepID=UPI002AC8D587|nr:MULTISPECIES: AraC family transcriptional regulator [unclassified Undibacterium]MEB0140429.1 AraC family transcriptional regulator [Undibacterium sp. CCC2.1]MEB0173924.1 AraC family transcriptional regulator [Undibacterium sp. CCC1.1]MEB0177402.1 AraC family transcriptional regulator [Undibacterium sp. CCC3.4]MEB0217101.1 AraC family transcriptional regulator [Undibacterium sp. 5I2]WPX45125.1 AraC family transcriptional regulator [Undibacterium sp. CCC3.4]
MDALSSVLALLKPQSYGTRGLDTAGDWSIEFPAGEGIKCYALLHGACWLEVEGVSHHLRINTGDCVLLPRGQAFRFFSTLDAQSISVLPLIAAVDDGNFMVVNGGGECTGLGAYFVFEGRQSDMLVGMLPPIVHFHHEADKALLRGYLERLMSELRTPQLGGFLIAEHMAQSLLIQALRLHLLDSSVNGIGWLYALRDDKLSKALEAIHGEPGRNWSLDSLAKVAGMSRSSFAASFSATLGASAIDYLTQWRMHIAAERLHHRVRSISVLAEQLGYQSESAFSVAFKRIHGSSPRQYAKRIQN